MGIAFAEWQNKNELRSYPLHDRATRADAGGSVLPNDILADLQLLVPASAGRYVYVSSVVVTEKLVSVTFLATDSDPFTATPTTLVPLAAIAVQKPIVQGRNYSVSALYPGVAGWVTFGAGATLATSGNYRLATPAAGLLAPKAYCSYQDYPLTSIGKAGNLTELTGLVRILGEGDVVVGSGVRTISGRRRTVLTIGLNLGDTPADMLRKYAGPCGTRPEDKTCASGKALASINGVEPDCYGNIDIIFSGLDPTQVRIAGGMLIDLPLGLDDVCTDFEPTRYDPVDLCASSSSSSVQPSSSSSSSSSSEAVAPTVPIPTEYYDEFDDPAATLGDGLNEGALVSVAGEWAIAPVASAEEAVNPDRLISETLIEPNVIRHRQIWRTASPGYWTFGVVRLADQGNGHVIFGYRDPAEFWYAGVGIRSPEHPLGYLYIGHRTGDFGSQYDNWPGGLEFGYQFDAMGEPNPDADPTAYPGSLLSNDFRIDVRVAVVPGSELRLVTVNWYWNRAFQGQSNPSVPFNTVSFMTARNLDGWLGLGSVACATHFASFGIFDLP